MHKRHHAIGRRLTWRLIFLDKVGTRLCMQIMTLQTLYYLQFSSSILVNLRVHKFFRQFIQLNSDF